MSAPLRPGCRPSTAAVERLEERTLLTSYVVNTLIDGVAEDGLLSLREAVQAASTNTAVNEADAGSAGEVDVITFSTGLPAGTITLAGGELAISGETSILGSGPGRLTISGNNVSRVFNVAADGIFTLVDLTVTAGNAGADAGGAILNAGITALIRTAVRGSTAGTDGGGLASVAGSTLRMQDSEISGNVAGDSGGGVWSDGTLSLSNVTVSGNAAAVDGGGIFYSVGTLRHLTVFGNRADSDGNASGTGGGIHSAAATTTLHNTLVAGNLRGAGAGTADDVAGVLSAASSHNLVADAATAGGLTDGTNGNIVGADVATLLDPVLRDNGGPWKTRTHALLPNSAAVDAGTHLQSLAPDPSGFSLAADQRGFARNQQAQVDIGAFEASPAADLVGFHAGGWWVGATTGTSFNTTLWAGWANVAWDAVGQADFDADGKADVYGLLDGSWWVALSTGSGYATPSRWAVWSNVDWQNVTTADLNGDGRADVIAKRGGNWWAATSTGAGFIGTKIWTSWQALPWREFFFPDLNGDDRADFLGFESGRWWAQLSDGAGFGPAHVWATWSNEAWQKLLILDADGDGQDDVAGLLRGSWWVGLSATPQFLTTRWALWANVAWADPLAGDFDGDGRDDVIARNGGNWWVGLSTGTAFAAPKLFAAWSNAAWKDVRVGDFDGNGLDDIAGRFNGQWWVGKSDGAAFTTSLWGTWSEVAWRAVAAADTTGPPDAPGSIGPLSPGPAAAFASPVPDDEPLALFWSNAREDEEFAGLLAV